jgi:hypothetical protein
VIVWKANASCHLKRNIVLTQSVIALVCEVLATTGASPEFGLGQERKEIRQEMADRNAPMPQRSDGNLILTAMMIVDI